MKDKHAAQSGRWAAGGHSQHIFLDTIRTKRKNQQSQLILVSHHHHLLLLHLLRLSLFPPSQPGSNINASVNKCLFCSSPSLHWNLFLSIYSSLQVFICIYYSVLFLQHHPHLPPPSSLSLSLSFCLCVGMQQTAARFLFLHLFLLVWI